MKIAYIVGRFPTLSETFILNQITALIDRGHEVDIYAEPPLSGLQTHPDVEKYDLPSRTYYRSYVPKSPFKRVWKAGGRLLTRTKAEISPALSSLNFLKYGYYARSLKLFYAVTSSEKARHYDIIHCHFGPLGNLGVLMREVGALTGKVVTTFHGYDIRRGLDKGPQVYKPLLRYGDYFIAISRYNRNCLEQLGFPPDRIVDHPIGIQTDRFPYRWDNGSVRPASGEPIRILTVARLVEEKGLDYGMRAIHQLLKDDPSLMVKYDIIGAGYLEEKLKNLAAELGLTDIVQFLGPRDQRGVAEHLGRSHIFLLPSIFEALPCVLSEAQSAGLPIVATDVGGVTELVAHGKSGFVVPARNVGALADKLGCLIRDPDLWPEMGRAGRSLVERRYDLNKTVDGLVEIFRRISSSGHVLSPDGPRERAKHSRKG